MILKVIKVQPGQVFLAGLFFGEAFWVFWGVILSALIAKEVAPSHCRLLGEKRRTLKCRATP